MRKGFTLLELLATIVIMSILGGIAINVFFPSLTKTYVAMVKQDIATAAQANLDYYTKHGEFVYSTKRLTPKADGMVYIKGYTKFPMSKPDAMRYEARFNRGVCSDSGKQGMLLEYWLNRGDLYPSPHLYGKYDSCKQSRVRVWEQIYKDGKKVWVER